jgi:hypothetical protein
MRPVLLVLVGALVLGCAPHARTEEGVAEGGRLAADLASSLEVGIAVEEVRLAFHVTNTSAAPIEFTFPTSQRYDFVVEGAGGALVWRWSDDRAFAQVVTRARLEPGETWTMEAVWAPAARTGEHVATGRLVAMDRPVEQRTAFELP